MNTSLLDVQLRDVIDSDLPIFYEHQNDPVANQMAAFPARDREAFMAHWARIRTDESNIMRTILYNGLVAGNIVSFLMDDNREVGYWIGREYWGKGIATRALELFLKEVKIRPLYGVTVKNNTGSQHVLEKCGFRFLAEKEDHFFFVLD